MLVKHDAIRRLLGQRRFTESQVRAVLSDHGTLALVELGYAAALHDLDRGRLPAVRARPCPDPATATTLASAYAQDWWADEGDLFAGIREVARCDG